MPLCIFLRHRTYPHGPGWLIQNLNSCFIPSWRMERKEDYNICLLKTLLRNTANISVMFHKLNELTRTNFKRSWELDKEAACQWRDPGSIPGLGTSPRVANGNPLSILTGKISWTEEPSGLQSMGSQSRTQLSMPYHTMPETWIHRC